MTTITASAGGGVWSSTGSWVGGALPTAADDVLLTAASGNITIDGTSGSPSLCRSLNCTGYTGTLTQASAKVLSIGDGSGGSLTLVSGMTYAPNSASTINFLSTTTGNTITCATKTLGAVVFNGVGGGWTFSDAFKSANCTLTKGALSTGAQTCTSAQFASNNSNTRSLDLTNTAWAMNNPAGTLWDITTATGMTLTSTGSTISCANGGQTFQGGGLIYNALTLTGTVPTIAGNNTFNGTVSFNAAGTLTTAAAKITGSNTIDTLSVTGTNGLNNFQLGADQTINTALTLTGASSTARMLIKSDISGTARTITCNGSITASNVDFRDITGAGSPSGGGWDLHAITGLSGDCGGNSGITFTTGINCYWKGLSANWTSGSSRFFTTSGGSTGARMPLPQDVAIFDANSFSSGSQTVTFSAQRYPKIDASAVTNTPAFALNNSNMEMYGDLILGTVTLTGSSSQSMTFAARGGQTLTPAGVSLPATPIIVDAVIGTLTINGAVTSSGPLTLTSGTIDNSANNSAMQFTTFTNTSASTRAIKWGNATWKFTGTGTVFNTTSGGFTSTAGGSTIEISDTSASTKTVNGGGVTYGGLTIDGAASNGIVTIDGGNTFALITLKANCSVKWTASTTTTATGFVTTASSGNTVTMQTTSAGNAATLSIASGTISCDWLLLKDSTAAGGATFYAGADSTDNGGNTGWIFSNAPTPFSWIPTFPDKIFPAKSGAQAPIGFEDFGVFNKEVITPDKWGPSFPDKIFPAKSGAQATPWFENLGVFNAEQVNIDKWGPRFPDKIFPAKNGSQAPIGFENFGIFTKERITPDKWGPYYSNPVLRKLSMDPYNRTVFHTAIPIASTQIFSFNIDNLFDFFA